MPGGSGDREMVPIIDDVLRAATRRLLAAGVPHAARDCRLLMGSVLGWDQARLIGQGDTEIDAEPRARFAALVARRERREPVSRILGQREFWSMTFALNAATLDPRPDSETLVEAALAQIGDPMQPVRIADLGTGSGCLLIALLSELPRAVGVGVDVSRQALQQACLNAQIHGVAGRSQWRQTDLLQSTWVDQIGAQFDLVIANPPYIPIGAKSQLAPEVCDYDPKEALFAGEDGLDFYRVITNSLHDLLAPAGAVVLEVGIGQAEPVTSLLRAQGMMVHPPWHDLAGVARVIVGTCR